MITIDHPPYQGKFYITPVIMVLGNWDTKHHTFLSWDEVQTKFKLIKANNEDWIMLTSKIIDKWRHLLEEVLEATHPGQ